MLLSRGRSFRSAFFHLAMNSAMVTGNVSTEGH